MERAGSPDRSTLIAFVGAVFIGGTNFVAVKFSNEGLPPFFGAALRFLAASLIFFAIMSIVRVPMPRERAARGAALYGFLGFGVGYASLYYALVGLSAGMASVIMASTPLVTLTFAVLHGQERFTTRGLIGGVLAIAGIATLSARAIGGSVEPIYFMSSLLGVAATAESSVLVKLYPRTHPITTNAVGMAVGGLFLAIISLAFGETWALPSDGRTWFVLLWLIVLGSVGLFALFLFVIGRWTASASVYALTLMPVVAVTLGIFLAGERLSVEMVVGSLLVLAAVYIGALSKKRSSPAPAPVTGPVAPTADP